MTFRSFKNKNKFEALAHLSKLILHNCEVFEKILVQCSALSLHHHRISSSIFPLLTHPEIQLDFEDLADFKKIVSTLKRTGEFACDNSISLSMHPAQYVVIASERETVREAAARDINIHSRFLDLLGQEQNYSSPINLHINSNGARPNFKANFESGMELLSKGARKRIVFENEDKGYWNPCALLNFLHSYKIPITFDFLHFKCNPCDISEREAFLKCAATWGKFPPVFHYAESKSNKEPRAHSDYCGVPPYFGIAYICEIEAKAKDDAVLKIFR